MEYECLDCGHLMSEDEFVEALESDEGCEECGSTDIDLFVR